MGNAHSTHDVMVSEKPTGYPTSIRSTRNNKKPQPFFNEAFFDRHMSPSALQAQQKVKKASSIHSGSQKSGHVNFFEVAARTTQPASSPKKPSSHTNSSASSIKTASTHTNNNQSYPSTINTHSQRAAKRINSTTSSINSNTGSQSSITSTSDKPSVHHIEQVEDSEYVTINGRKYWKGHGSQTFILPCDDDENDRLMTMHYILKSALHGNFISPIKDLLQAEAPKQAKVLDIGCGSGTWILEMATEFPNTEFHGVDDCPLFPTSIKPANAHFKLHNVLEGLPFEDNQFDFVYMRLMVLYFTPEELAKLLREISRVMKPGGYFEVVDTNYNIRSPGPFSYKIVNSAIKKLLNLAEDTPVQSYESNTNHPIFTFLMLAPQHASNNFVVNFVDICQEHTTLPLGGWGGGQIGNLHGENFKQLLGCLQYKLPASSNSSLDETLEKALTLEEERPALPLSKSTIHTILDECEQHKSYLDWFACYARKPLDDDQLEQSTLDSIYEFVEGFVDV